MDELISSTIIRSNGSNQLLVSTLTSGMHAYRNNNLNNNNLNNVENNNQKHQTQQSKKPIKLHHPKGVAIDLSDNLYVADFGANVIRKIALEDPTPDVFCGQVGVGGCSDGVGNLASFNSPLGITIDQTSGMLFVCDFSNHTVRQITRSRVVSTLAGQPTVGGYRDGFVSEARFNFPRGLCCDSLSKVLYVCDTENQIIRKIDLKTKLVSTVYGFPGLGGCVDGSGLNARLKAPAWATVDWNGHLYISDNDNNSVRRANRAGAVNTICGSHDKEDTEPFGDGRGDIARFYNPRGTVLDLSGILILADYGNHCMRKIECAVYDPPPPKQTLQSKLQKLFLQQQQSSRDLLQSSSSAAPAPNSPGGSFLNVAPQANNTTTTTSTTSSTTTTTTTTTTLTSSNSNSSYNSAPSSPRASASTCSPKLWTRVSVTTYAGQPNAVGTEDGTGLDSFFNAPVSVVMHPRSGDLYVVDEENHNVRRISNTGLIPWTFAGVRAATQCLRIVRLLLCSISQKLSPALQVQSKLILHAIRGIYVSAGQLDALVSFASDRKTIGSLNKRQFLLHVFRIVQPDYQPQQGAGFSNNPSSSMASMFDVPFSSSDGSFVLSSTPNSNQSSTSNLNINSNSFHNQQTQMIRSDSSDRFATMLTISVPTPNNQQQQQQQQNIHQQLDLPEDPNFVKKRKRDERTAKMMELVGDEDLMD